MPNKKKSASRSKKQKDCEQGGIEDVLGRVSVTYDAGQGSMALDQNPIRPIFVPGTDNKRAQITFTLVSKSTNNGFDLYFGNIMLCDFEDQKRLCGDDGEVEVQRRRNENCQDEWTFIFDLNSDIKPHSKEFEVQFDVFCVYEPNANKNPHRRRHAALRQITGHDPSMLLPPGG